MTDEHAALAAPVTEAGRRLQHDLLGTNAGRRPGVLWMVDAAILAIEAEARAALLSEIRQRVEAIQSAPDASEEYEWVPLPAVLAILDELAKP